MLLRPSSERSSRGSVRGAEREACTSFSCRSASSLACSAFWIFSSCVGFPP